MRKVADVLLAAAVFLLFASALAAEQRQNAPTAADGQQKPVAILAAAPEKQEEQQQNVIEEVVREYRDDGTVGLSFRFRAPDEKKPAAAEQPSADELIESDLPLLPEEEIVPEPAQLGHDVVEPKKDAILITIEEAIRQYRADDFAGAVSNLDYASQLIRQKKSERMKALLPEPFAGWQAKSASAQALGTAVFGGGLTVSRDYFSSAGAIVSIEIVSDSPVLQSVIMMLNNPLFAGASGGSLQTIKGQRAIIKYNARDRSGEINVVVAGRLIVTVKGRQIDEPSLLRYVEAVDFVALARN